MIGRVARLFAAEMMKVWRTKFPYLGLIATALVAVVARQSVLAFAQPEEITASSYFGASIVLASTLIIPIFATIFASMLVASEVSRGTLRTILTRPVNRVDFLTAKLLSGLFYLLLLYAANIAVAIPIASTYPLKSAFDEGVPIPSFFGQIGIYGVALALSLLPQFTTVCFGFFVSVLSGNVATAIGVAVGLLLSMETIKHFVRFGGFELERWVFSTYFDKAMGIAGSKASGMIYESWWQDKIIMLIVTSIASAVVFLAISYWVFTRKDLNV